MTDTAKRSEDGRIPAVSVVIPVHNCERFAAEAIESFLGQTLQDFELILVDDGSTDGSAAILDDYAARDPRVRVVRHDEARGPGAARNTGIDIARAALLALSDADDVSVSDRLERQKAYLDAHPEIGFVASPRIATDLDGNDIGVQRIPYEGTELVERLKHYCYIGHAAAMYRTQALRDIGGYRNGFAAAQDYDLLLRLVEKTNVGVLHVPFYRYRQVPTGIKYGAGEVQHRSADIARLFARQRAEKGCDDYDDYMQTGRMPRSSGGAGDVSLPRYYHKLARTALDCGAYLTMLKVARKGVRSGPAWLPKFAALALAGAVRLALQATGTLDWFERTFRGR